jgi:hypothetical protein
MDSSQNTRIFRSEHPLTLFYKDEHAAKSMTPSPSQSPQKKISPELCKHPRVQIVSRDEDSEYVECQECGDVFESSEFKDMNIEETKLRDEE